MKINFRAMKLPTLLISVLFALFSAELQANSLNPQILAPRLSYLDTNKGLNQNTIHDVHVDKQGFVWLGTDEGLNRFDGVKVLPVVGLNLELSGNSVFQIFEHSNGLFYLSTLNDGIISFDRDTQKFTTVLKKSYAFVEQWTQYSEGMIELPDGNMIIGLNEQVFRHNVKTKENTLLYQLPDDKKLNNQAVRSVYLHNDILLIGTVDGLLAQNLNTDTTHHLYKDFEFSTDSRNVKFLDSFDGATLIVGSVEGLYSISLGEITKVVDDSWALSHPRVINQSRNIWDIATVDKNKAFVATDIGLYELDLKTLDFTYLFEPRKKLELMTGLDIINLALDRYGNVWMGTKKRGAMYWSPTSILFNNVYNSIFTQEKELLTSNTVSRIYQHDANTLFIATSNGLNKYNLLTGEIEHFYVKEKSSPQYTESEVYSLASSTRQFLWLGTAGGMRKFDVFANKDVPFNNFSKEIQTLFSTFIYDFHLVNKDEIWIITEEGLFTVDLLSQIVTRIDTETSGLPIIRVSQFLGADTRTNSIILAASTSVWSIDIHSKLIKKLHSIKNSASQTIFAGGWARGNDNSIWLTYPAHGLYKLDGDTYKVLDFYNIENHLPTNISYGVMFDGDNDLWFSSHSGIHVLNVKTNNVHSFGFVNGLAQSEFNQNAYTKLADGRLVYGGYMGFSLFNPLKMKEFSDKITKGTSITEVDLSTRKLQLPLTSLNGQTIQLEHDDVGITLYFSSLNFDVLSRTLFQYRIISDGEAINYPMIETNKIALPLLSPGQHIIEVFTPGTTDRNDIASLTINVSYPTFASPTAYVIYVILLCLLVGYIMLRQRKIRFEAQCINEALLIDNRDIKEALLASNAGTWEWDSTTQLMRSARINLDIKSAEKNSRNNENNAAVHIDDYIRLMNKYDRANFKSKWETFLSGREKYFDISYRIQGKNGVNLWYRDVGSFVSNGALMTVKGTYTNLNSAVAAQEKLKLFGNAFKHSRDWVLIFSKEKVLIATNPAFKKAFGVNPLESDISKQTSLMIEHQEQLHRTIKKLGSLKAGEIKKSESTLTIAGKKLTMLSDFNAIGDANNPSEIDYYLIIASDISEQINAQKELQKLAYYDVLTGLVNRTLLLERIKQSIYFANRHNKQLAIILIDLDSFKTVNEKFGHVAGDGALKATAHRIQEICADHYTIGRLGGDKFVVVLEDATVIQKLNSIVVELIKSIAQPLAIGKQTVALSACAGIAVYPSDAADAESLISNVSIAVNAAKQKGTKQYCHFADIFESTNKA